MPFSARDLRPMLAVGGDPEPPLTGEAFVYEPKYDGIRAIVEIVPGRPGASVRMWSRNGNEKTAQFPDIAEVLAEWGAVLDGPVVLDGEIVAVDEDDRPQGFQRLQHRIHVSVPGYRSSKPMLKPEDQGAAFIVFDLLAHANQDLRDRPLTDRRQALERLIEAIPPPSSTFRMSEQIRGDGRALHQRATEQGWEGLLVKVARSPYRAGKRSSEWRKLKLQNVDDFVIAGWTAPQGTRARFGALILGTYDEDSGALRYAGDVGTGFTGDEIERLWRRLQPLEIAKCPFAVAPKVPGKAHWVTPTLSAQVRYTEMTDEGRLRHPAYLGLRDDKEGGVQTVHTVHTVPRVPKVHGVLKVQGSWVSAELAAIVDRLTELETTRKDGKVTLPDGDTLDITNLQKVFWPQGKRTKGDLLRYYARIAPVILPVIDNRPLVMKRLPNGVEGKAFYQHRAPEPVPPGVRIETLPDDDVPARLVGGSLKTLLYMAQLASISMDPWFSTMDALDLADQVAIDLDPQPGATFAQILDVARWVHEVLQKVNVRGYPKTSGSEGLHIYIPLPPDTPYDAGMLFCQIVATMVATRHPKVATVERTVRRRKDQTIYVDYLQNIQGKTLACAYSARGSAFAGVSTPLTWEEVYDAPAPQDFTIESMATRVAAVGDLWADLRRDKGADLLSAIERLR